MHFHPDSHYLVPSKVVGAKLSELMGVSRLQYPNLLGMLVSLLSSQKGDQMRETEWGTQFVVKAADGRARYVFTLCLGIDRRGRKLFAPDGVKRMVYVTDVTIRPLATVGSNS